jgi:DNA-binding transcriptional MerR regulator
MNEIGSLRIGEFARRVGVSPELLRAWERRYALLQPVRSPGGFRLYTSEDATRVARMRRALDDGLSAAEAARIALDATPPAEPPLQAAAARLLAATRDYDEGAVQAVLDECFEGFGTDTVLRNVVLPALKAVGSEWEQGTLDVSQEHFVSNIIRGRLLSFARHWGRGSGPVALLACAPGEAHDISLISFGLVLRSYGWRIVFLGADTPVETLERTVATTRPALTVVTSFDASLLQAQVDSLRALAGRAALALSGPGATDSICERIGAGRLDDDVVAAAQGVALGNRLEPESVA